MRQIPPAEIAGKIMTLIDQARNEVVIVSPYNRFWYWKKLRNRLKRAMGRKLGIVYYVRDGQDHRDVVALGIEPRPVPNLHAKVYLNEDRGIVTSMNLTQASDDSSIEIGYETQSHEELLELRRFVDEHVASRAVAPVRTIPPRALRAMSGSALQRKPVVTWQDAVDWTAWQGFLRALTLHLNVDCTPEEASSGRAVRLHDDLFLDIYPRRSYLQLAFRLGASRHRSHLLYDALTSQSESIQKEIGIPIAWGSQRRQMKINLDNFPVENPASWPEDAVQRIAELISTSVTVLSHSIENIDRSR